MAIERLWSARCSSNRREKLASICCKGSVRGSPSSACGDVRVAAAAPRTAVSAATLADTDDVDDRDSATADTDAASSPPVADASFAAAVVFGNVSDRAPAAAAATSLLSTFGAPDGASSTALSDADARAAGVTVIEVALAYE